MTEKRFRIVHLRDKSICDIQDNAQEIPTFYNDLTYNMGSAKQVCDLLNKYAEENEQLKHNNKMLSMKMSEVSTKYRLLKEFSEDTNPNDAVKTVLHELMMITKEYR